MVSPRKMCSRSEPYSKWAVKLIGSGEPDRVLGGSGGREVARLWRLKQLEYSFRLTGWSARATGVSRR
jgi:hypothetical protein